MCRLFFQTAIVSDQIDNSSWVVHHGHSNYVLIIWARSLYRDRGRGNVRGFCWFSRRNLEYSHTISVHAVCYLVFFILFAPIIIPTSPFGPDYSLVLIKISKSPVLQWSVSLCISHIDLNFENGTWHINRIHSCAISFQVRWWTTFSTCSIIYTNSLTIMAATTEIPSRIRAIRRSDKILPSTIGISSDCLLTQTILYILLRFVTIRDWALLSFNALQVRAISLCISFHIYGNSLQFWCWEIHLRVLSRQPVW